MWITVPVWTTLIEDKWIARIYKAIPKKTCVFFECVV